MPWTKKPESAFEEDNKETSMPLLWKETDSVQVLSMWRSILYGSTCRPAKSRINYWKMLQARRSFLLAFWSMLFYPGLIVDILGLAVGWSTIFSSKFQWEMIRNYLKNNNILQRYSVTYIYPKLFNLRSIVLRSFNINSIAITKVQPALTNILCKGRLLFILIFSIWEVSNLDFSI